VLSGGRSGGLVPAKNLRYASATWLEKAVHGCGDILTLATTASFAGVLNLIVGGWIDGGSELLFEASSHLFCCDSDGKISYTSGAALVQHGPARTALNK